VPRAPVAKIDKQKEINIGHFVLNFLLGVFSAVRAIGPFIAKKGLLYHSFF
jgi:hypothetical protein